MGGRLSLLLALPCTCARFIVQIPPVLVVVAIDAEVLPVAAVRRVVFMVVVFVMDRQEMEILDGEFPAAAGADPGMNSQGLLSVALQALIQCLAGPGNNPVQILLAPLLTTDFFCPELFIPIFRFSSNPRRPKQPPEALRLFYF